MVCSDGVPVGQRRTLTLIEASVLIASKSLSESKGRACVTCVKNPEKVAVNERHRELFSNIKKNTCTKKSCIEYIDE